MIKFVNNMRFSLTPVSSTNKTERHGIKHPSPKILALINVVVIFKLYVFTISSKYAFQSKHYSDIVFSRVLPDELGCHVLTAIRQPRLSGVETTRENLFVTHVDSTTNSMG